MTLPATITAAVAPSAIDKVGRLFNGSPTDVLHELLQNARRAGATGVDIAVQELAGRLVLVVSDNGRGIDDPAMLLALGASDWSDGTRASEDPAGMGVFSMAGLRVEYISWSATAKQGWRAVIEQDAWSGKRPVAVETREVFGGTEVIVDLPAAWEAQMARAVAAAVLHYPLEVSFQGEAVEQRDWLAGALRIELWHGSRIGIFHESYRDCGQATLNFHGLTVPLPLPCIGEVDRGRSWFAKVDIGDTPELQLVLPARKEVVQSPFIEELKQACEAAIFRTIARGGAHRLSAVNVLRALVCGVELADADPMLHGWKPAKASSYDQDRGDEMRRPMIRMRSFEPALEQTLARAIANRPDMPLCLVDSETAFEGYEWYDALEQVVGLRVRTMRDGTEWIFTDYEKRTKLVSGPVEEIHVEIDIEGPNGARRTVTYSTDVAIVPVDDYCYDLDAIRLLVAPAPAIDVPELVTMLEGAAFSPSDDRDADSFDTQQEYFHREAAQLARTHLISEDAAIVGRAADRVRDHICWLVPEDRTLVMTVRRDGVRAELCTVPATVHGAAEFALAVLALTHIDSDDPVAVRSALAAIRALAAAPHHEMERQVAPTPTEAG